MKTKEMKRTVSGLGLNVQEFGLLLFAGLMCLIAIVAPNIHQPDSYHAFADQRTLLCIPCALDVLSNLPFAIAGLVGLVLLRQKKAIQNQSQTLHDMLMLFFYGLVITSVCSSVYHLNPNNQFLWLDRMGMTVSFAGILGVAVTSRISNRAGRATAYTVLIAAPITLWIWQTVDNLTPWCMMQLGGTLLILILAFIPSKQNQIKIPLIPIALWYALAKLFETFDQQIFAFTTGIVSGHSLKHVIAAMAAAPILMMLYRLRSLSKPSV